ncbi:MAG: FkbM family methyltransferase [Acidobacteriota bacterium]
MSVLQKIAGKTAGAIGRDSWLVRKLRPAYESLLDLTTGGKGIPWIINGVTYRIDPHHRHRLGQDYDAPVATFLREQVKPGAICLDVGANVGVYVLQFAYWSRPHGRVIAFEPNPGALKVLRKHIELNDLTERVEVVPAAVAALAGEATMYAADSDGMSRLGAPNRALENRVSQIKVPLVTLDEYCRNHSIVPDWLFIDIEGFEIAALAGAREIIKSRGKELGIIVEMHPDVWDSADTTLEQAKSLLAELGLRVEALTGQRDPLNEHGLTYLAHL